MRVLLSIKPEFALKIFNGSKKYEYRRRIFKRQEITTIVVYASEPIKKVIGEFTIGDILHEEPLLLWAKTGHVSGITKDRFLKYFNNKPRGYAIQVKDSRVFDIPLPIGEFVLSRPPQSFTYVREAHPSIAHPQSTGKVDINFKLSGSPSENSASSSVARKQRDRAVRDHQLRR